VKAVALQLNVGDVASFEAFALNVQHQLKTSGIGIRLIIY
jgi:hypothetical protein